MAILAEKVDGVPTNPPTSEGQIFGSSFRKKKLRTSSAGL